MIASETTNSMARGQRFFQLNKLLHVPNTLFFVTVFSSCIYVEIIRFTSKKAN